MATREEITALMQGDEFDRLIELLQLGEEAVPILIDIMKDSTAPVFMRHRATAALGEIRSPTAAPDIEATLTDADPVQRIMSIRALVKIVGDGATGALVSLLEDPDQSVSNAAIQGLAAAGNPTALAALEDFKTRSENDILQTQAKDAIKDIKDRIT
jgi:HEAT repeat protein